MPNVICTVFALIMDAATPVISMRPSGNIVKSFASIPGPKSFPGVGTLIHYLPIIGEYRFDDLLRNGFRRYQKFGPVVREEIVPGTNVIWIFEPEDIRELFRREGKYPERRSHLALGHYRSSRRDLYNTGGLLPTNGPEWGRLRKSFQKGLSSPRDVRAFLPRTNEVIDRFVVHCCRHHLRKGDFLSDLSRLFLEILALILFEYRLDSFSEKELQPGSMTSRLIESTWTINSCILKTDNGLQAWRFFDTPLYNKLKKAHNYLESVAKDFLDRAVKAEKDGSKEQSLVEKYLSTSEVDLKDVMGMSVDMLLAGIDTVTYSATFALYHLATNRDKQEKVHLESRELLCRADDPVTGDTLSQAEYLKAALKESLRLNPVSVGVGRILSEDATFSGYRVPKGNIVVTQNQVTSLFPKFFPEPSKFVPERWLKGGVDQETISPHVVLPFGHGPRACIARRLAEQNMQAVLLKLCRSFSIGWSGKVLGFKSELINKPDGPLAFSFTPRDDAGLWKPSTGE